MIAGCFVFYKDFLLFSLILQHHVATYKCCVPGMFKVTEGEVLDLGSRQRSICGILLPVKIFLILISREDGK